MKTNKLELELGMVQIVVKLRRTSLATMSDYYHGLFYRFYIASRVCYEISICIPAWILLESLNVKKSVSSCFKKFALKVDK